MDALPSFYDDLDAFRGQGWRRLSEGAGDRHSPFHTPALATVDPAGRPRLRTVVLRAADAGAGTVRFHCDRRSDKAREIGGSGHAALHVYDARAKLQLRVEGRARLHHDDAIAEAAWAGALAMSRVCYGIEPAPGTALAAGDAYALPGEDPEARLGRENFCAVVLTAERMDLLYLDRRGHRRAVFLCETGAWSGNWVAP